MQVESWIERRSYWNGKEMITYALVSVNESFHSKWLPFQSFYTVRSGLREPQFYRNVDFKRYILNINRNDIEIVWLRSSNNFSISPAEMSEDWPLNFHASSFCRLNYSSSTRRIHLLPVATLRLELKIHCKINSLHGAFACILSWQGWVIAKINVSVEHSFFFVSLAGMRYMPLPSFRQFNCLKYLDFSSAHLHSAARNFWKSKCVVMTFWPLSPLVNTNIKTGAESFCSNFLSISTLTLANQLTLIVFIFFCFWCFRMVRQSTQCPAHIVRERLKRHFSHFRKNKIKSINL